MMDAKALLDSLMGPSRDKDLKDQRSDGWKDENVCKRFLIGFCPNNQHDIWFNARRRDLGVCTKVHSEALRKQFENHPEREKYLPIYEKEFLTYLESVITECDAFIAKERKKAAPAGVETRIPVHLKGTVKEMKQQSEECLKRAEEAAEKGDVEGSKKLVAQAGKLKEDLEELKARYTVEHTGENVCEVCGVRCLPGEQADYEAHLEGKLHLGYKKIREKAAELRSKKRAGREGAQKDEERRERRRSRSRDKDKDRRSDRESVRDRQRQGDKDRDGDRDRRKDGDRKGDREKSDRGRDREKDRSRDRDKRKDKSRSRDRSSDRRKKAEAPPPEDEN